ncbi:Uu.00g035560.m01.CDS01 [Anthostomella pinea]|uniref:Uu.00g035560.m01.CDS01 n=1 Tax=Anthostomella pinea TaxID=933095 RepID=A0AAI8YDL5_9PEZI|nr:Uu.00g035560.m01.CDS01 [Anthostomella pinea]
MAPASTKKDTKKLFEVLPRGGFNWLSSSKKFYISNNDAQIIVRALQKSSHTLNKTVVGNRLALFLGTATKHIDDCDCAKVSPPDFWGMVGAEVPWIKGQLDDTTLHQLALKIFAARGKARSNASFYRDDFEREDLAREELGDSELTRATDSFRTAFLEKYGVMSETRDAYMPRWTKDSDNEGDEEATRLRFQERLAVAAANHGRRQTDDQGKTLVANADDVEDDVEEDVVMTDDTVMEDVLHPGVVLVPAELRYTRM